MTEAVDRFVKLVQRELGASHVVVASPGESLHSSEPGTAAAASGAVDSVAADLSDDGATVLAYFDRSLAAHERESLSRRLAMLAATFADVVLTPSAAMRAARPAVATSLHEELRALAARTSAYDVLVIDCDSPVIWGSALLPSAPCARGELALRDMSDRELSQRDEPSEPRGVARGDRSDESGPIERDAGPPSEPADATESRAGSRGGARAETEALDLDSAQAVESVLTKCVVERVRALPALELVRKGRHVRHVERGDAWALVLSFSSIYLLCFVFDGEFDELRAERAAHEALPRIERLVEALPPLTPGPRPIPLGNAVAVRKTRPR